MLKTMFQTTFFLFIAMCLTLNTPVTQAGAGQSTAGGSSQGSSSYGGGGGTCGGGGASRGF